MAVLITIIVIYIGQELTNVFGIELWIPNIIFKTNWNTGSCTFDCNYCLNCYDRPQFLQLWSIRTSFFTTVLVLG